ncbi:MAG TPA: hypothetical protein VF808_11815 [Ktedonobacterales bacterium]
MAVPEKQVVAEDVERSSLDTARFRRIFGVVAGICIAFVLATATAMMLYPGGARPIASTHGYQFLLNSFSDLGQTRTQSGAANYPSMALFTSAMLAVGVGAGGFFVAFARYFASHDASPLARRLNQAATLLGLASAACFAGVGLTPYNLLLPEHQFATNGAFYLLLAAVVLEFAALWRLRSMPASLLWVNGAFVVALAAYVWVLVSAPPATTLHGDEVRVIAQKLIVYTAIATIFAQALLIRAHLARPRAAYAGMLARMRHE